MTRQIMEPQEFRDEGFLQEVNRQFFHPLGLAMAVNIDYGLDEDGYMSVYIWDERDDPEGWFFAEGEISQEKADKVEALRDSKRVVRNARLNRPDHHYKIFGRDTIQGTGEVVK